MPELNLGRKGHLACGDRSSTPVRAACVDSTGGRWSERPGSFPCTWSTGGEGRIRLRVARSPLPYLQIPARTGVVLATFLAALAVILRVVLAVAVLARPAVACVAVSVALAPATANLSGSDPYRLGATRSSLTVAQDATIVSGTHSPRGECRLNGAAPIPRR